jgi:hypothetical protein
LFRSPIQEEEPSTKQLLQQPPPSTKLCRSCKNHVYDPHIRKKPLFPTALAVTTVASKMPATAPVSNADVSWMAHRPLRMRKVVVAMRIRVIGIVIICRRGFVAIIIFERVVPPVACIRRAGD